MVFPASFFCEFLLYFLRCRATFLRISIMDWPRVSAANHAIYGGQRTRYNTCMLSDHRSTYAHTHVAFINVVMHGTSESRAGVTLISAANHVVMHGTSESRATHGTSEYRCTVALLPVRGKGGKGEAFFKYSGDHLTDLHFQFSWLRQNHLQSMHRCSLDLVVFVCFHNFIKKENDRCTRLWFPLCRMTVVIQMCRMTNVQK